jgi:heptose I phosphotransferase
VLAVEELAGMLPLNEAIPLAAQRNGVREFEKWKRGLTAEMARLTNLLHNRRRYHKDLYLCHFYIPEAFTRTMPAWTGQVWMIDFHRLTAHPWTWPIGLIKDLAELLYSSSVEGVGMHDRARFWRCYLQGHSRTATSRWFRWLILAKWRRYRDHNAKRHNRIQANVSQPSKRIA